MKEKQSEEEAGQFVRKDMITVRFRELLRELNINGRRGLGFYTLRHCFQTIGGDAKDPDAVSAIMEHVDSSMAGLYRDRISDERLQSVTETVRMWLWPPKQRPRKNNRGRKQKPGKT